MTTMRRCDYFGPANANAAATKAGLAPPSSDAIAGSDACERDHVEQASGVETRPSSTRKCSSKQVKSTNQHFEQ